MTDQPFTVHALSWDEATRSHTKPITYNARDIAEARNWKRFNENWMTGFRIIDNATGKTRY